MRNSALFLYLFASVFFISPNTFAIKTAPSIQKSIIFQDSKPWTRWWWFASTITKPDIKDNLVWLKNNGFGGVEIAWVYPLNRMKKDTVNYTPRQEWLSAEWTEMVEYSKHCADSLQLGTDFTFGSLWPFGDTKVPFGEGTKYLNDTLWRKKVRASWEFPRKGYVIDHLSKVAFENYATRTGNALKPALKGSISGLFCDSWEVENNYLTTNGFEKEFEKQYSYAIKPYIDSLYSKNEPYKSVRYDYMKLISSYVIDSFYNPFTNKSHQLGAYSRAQCAGAPVDIISAYAAIDIPESEALLYEPSYSNIVASAAALSGKKVVSAETFTCIYGWPADHFMHEQTADLKLLADAVFANGVNQIIWHGKPFNPAGQDTVKFYASVHVGKSGSLAAEIPAFNRYMEKVSGYMKKGHSFSEVAVYLPTEDAWIAGELPIEKQFIWASGEYEHRYTYLPEELKAWRPMWINNDFLQQATFKNGRLQVGDFSFASLYIDVKFLDISALKRVLALASQGLPVCLKQVPSEPGFIKSVDEYQQLVTKLLLLKNVKSEWSATQTTPALITGSEKFDFWCRESSDGLYVFCANPRSQQLTFPMEFGQSLNEKTDTINIQLHYNKKSQPFQLVFKPYQSILLYITPTNKVELIDIDFMPKTPIYNKRIKTGKEKWEVTVPNK